MDGSIKPGNASPCFGCRNRRDKTDPRLAQQGLIECSAPAIEASVAMAAVCVFAATGRVDVPFVVEGDRTCAAWPLQFDRERFGGAKGERPGKAPVSRAKAKISFR